MPLPTKVKVALDRLRPAEARQWYRLLARLPRRERRAVVAMFVLLDARPACCESCGNPLRCLPGACPEQRRRTRPARAGALR